MGNVKKIKYSNYKYEAYKRLNKLVLEQMEEIVKSRLPKGYVVTSPDNLEFQIQYDVPENRYRIEGFYERYPICSLFCIDEPNSFHAVMKFPNYPKVSGDFFEKILSPIKKLMNYSLQENVTSVKLYVDDSQIYYSRLNSRGRVIESGNSGYYKRGN